MANPSPKHINIIIVWTVLFLHFYEVDPLGNKCHFTPQPGIRMNRKCYWKTNGWNLSSAEDECERYDGTLFSFGSLDEGRAVLEVFNASKSEVLIGAILNDVNGSTYYDWLATPDRSRDLLNHNLTISERDDTSKHCVKFQDGRLVAATCGSVVKLSICQRDDQEDCPCEIPTNDTAGDDVDEGGPDLDFLQIPGPNGTTMNMSFLSVLDRVLDHSNYTESSECARSDDGAECRTTDSPDNTATDTSTTDTSTTDTSTTDTSTNVTDTLVERNNTDVNDGATTQGPDFSRSVTPRMTESISTNAPNNTTATAVGPAPPTHHFQIPIRTGASGSHPMMPQTGVQHVGWAPVIDAKFQVSGLHLGNVLPMNAGPRPLLTTAHIDYHDVAGVLRNTTMVLQNLLIEELVDNSTLQIFANTVNDVVGNKHILSVPDNVKEDLFIDIMRVAEQLMDSMPVVDEAFIISTENLDIVSQTIGSMSSVDNQVKIKTATSSPSDEITLSTKAFHKQKGVRVSVVTYKKLGSLRGTTISHVGSKVTSVTVQSEGGRRLAVATPHVTDVIILRLETTLEEGRVEHKRLCTFWDFANRTWSTEGCRLISKTRSHTTCGCSHLTNFAVLIPIGSQQALFTLTTVGCSLSIACLATTLIAFVYLRMLSNEKIMIHANLCLALMLAQIVFVSSNDAHNHKVGCKVVAILLHFLFLASFAWMLVEGINLYLCCTKRVFGPRDNRVKYVVLGWGLPALIVVVSFAAEFPGYGTGPQRSCWLSVQHGLIWAFLGPMIAIVLLNILVMALVVRAFLTLKATSQKTDLARLGGSLRAMLTLLPLLGSGWILSLLVPLSVVFQYFFVIVNTVQGMCIFFLHCICNDEIRKRFRAKRRRWSTTRTGSDVDTAHHNRRKTGSFDAAFHVVMTPVSDGTVSDRRSAWS